MPMSPQLVAVSEFAGLLATAAAVLVCRVIWVARRAKSVHNEPIEGEIGAAATQLNPAGWVQVRGSVVRASSLTPVERGARIVVVEGGSTLVVKPL